MRIAPNGDSDITCTDSLRLNCPMRTHSDFRLYFHQILPKSNSVYFKIRNSVGAGFKIIHLHDNPLQECIFIEELVGGLPISSSKTKAINFPRTFFWQFRSPNKSSLSEGRARLVQLFTAFPVHLSKDVTVLAPVVIKWLKTRNFEACITLWTTLSINIMDSNEYGVNLWWRALLTSNK